MSNFVTATTRSMFTHTKIENPHDSAIFSSLNSYVYYEETKRKKTHFSLQKKSFLFTQEFTIIGVHFYF